MSVNWHFQYALVDLRPAKVCNGRQGVDNLLLLGPGDIGGQGLRSAGNITRRELQDDISKPLTQRLAITSRSKFELTNLWSSLAIKHKSMEELCARNRHQQPAAEPPRALAKPPLLVHYIVQKLQAASRKVDRCGQPHLFLGCDGECKARQAGADSGGKARGQRTGDPRIAVAERFSVSCAEVCSESNKEPIEQTVQEKQEG